MIKENSHKLLTRDQCYLLLASQHKDLAHPVVACPLQSVLKWENDNQLLEIQEIFEKSHNQEKFKPITSQCLFKTINAFSKAYTSMVFEVNCHIINENFHSSHHHKTFYLVHVQRAFLIKVIKLVVITTMLNNSTICEKQNVIIKFLCWQSFCRLTFWEPGYDIFVLWFQPKKQQFSVALPTP